MEDPHSLVKRLRSFVDRVAVLASPSTTAVLAVARLAGSTRLDTLRPMQRLSNAAPDRDRRFFLASTCILLLAALPRFWSAWFDHGVFWPDEIFQSVEQAHRLVFGYGIVPWEFRDGARSWLFPGLVAIVLKLGAWLGLETGQALMTLVKSCMALLSLITLYLSMRLAHSLAGTRAAVIAGAIGAAFTFSLLLASKCFSETATAPVLIGSFMLTRPSATGSADTDRRRQLLAGALVGLAIGLRYQSGIVACGLLGVLVLERRYREAAWFAAGATAAGLLVGLLDWYTWGSPFYALKQYVYFNVKKSGARFGRHPFYYFAHVAITAVGPTIALIAVGFALGIRVAPKLALIVAGYVLVHSLVPHKEFRFLMPIMPMLFAVVGAGWAKQLERVRSPRTAAMLTVALGTVSVVAMGYQTTRLTWGNLGFPSDRGERSPWHSGEGINRLLSRVGQRPDVCGVMVTGESFGWIGGYSYFHRDRDLYPGTSEPERRAANYLIAPADTAPLPGYDLVDSARDARLLRRAGGCAAAPVDYRRELPR
ncbi:MAG: hypothetical protein RL701_5773 [Pseudomonadota bacterium]